MSSDRILAGCLLYIFVSEIVHAVHVHRLLNKLMSRNFNDYQFNQNLDKTLQPHSNPERIPVNPQDAEDLGALAGLN